MKRITTGWGTNRISRNGMTETMLAAGSATLDFFAIISNNREGLATWAAELIEDFCYRETMHLAQVVMSRSAAAAMKTHNGQFRNHTWRPGHMRRSDRLAAGWYEDELGHATDSRTKGFSHRPKKGRPDMVGINRKFR